MDWALGVGGRWSTKESRGSERAREDRGEGADHV